MDLSFNMDFILRDCEPKRITNFGDINEQKQSVPPEVIFVEEREENMLPDSSLSPSNPNIVGYVNDDRKLSDTEYTIKSIDKKKIIADMGTFRKKYKLVKDYKGEKYWVFEPNLVPFLGGKSDGVDRGVVEQSKECVKTITKATNAPATSHGVLDVIRVHTPPNISQEHNDHNYVLDTFLHASHMALIDVKLAEVEQELWGLDDYALSKFINSGNNLKDIPGQRFILQVPDVDTCPSVAAMEAEINERDDARRIRLRQIIKKHSELKKWLSKIRKRLKDKSISKLGRIIDFSSKERHELPLPLCATGGKDTHMVIDSSCDDHLPSNVPMLWSPPKSGGLERHHMDHECSTIAGASGQQRQQHKDHSYCQDSETNPSEELCHILSPMTISPDSQTTRHKGHIYEKNIFSTILSLSQEMPEPEGIPMLTYEYENYKVHTRSRGPSTDSEALGNHSPPTPDLRRADLDCNDISEATRVLVVQKKCLRAGVIHLANKEDKKQVLWRVTLDGERKCQDLLMSEWQLLEQGVREVIPTSVNQLAPGSRVCASRSDQLPENLYSGTITKATVDHVLGLSKLPICFDDGDYKDVDLHQVRLLPENFQNLYELMKAPNIADSNFYSNDRKRAARKKRTVTLVNSEDGGMCYKECKVEKQRGYNRKRVLKNVPRRKKVVVHWKLLKPGDGRSSDEYELVRDLDGVCVRAGDSVQLLSYSKHNYMAHVVSVRARKQSAVMDIQCNWYYILADVQDNSDIIRRLKRSTISKKVIFKTNHCDINDVYCVLRKVEVLPFDEYRMKYLMRQCSRKDIPDDSYVLAGRYDQKRTRVESLDEDIRHYLMSSEVD